MATAGGEKTFSGDILIKSTNEFEIEIREKLKWSNKRWEQSGESASRVKKLCSSLNYWKSKLKPEVEDTSIVVTLFNTEKDVKMELFKIVQAIELIDSDIKVVGIADFRNPRYICFYFSSKENRDIIKEKFRLVENNYVIYLSWALEAGDALSVVKVHWLPMTLKIEKIKKELDKYVLWVEEERVAINFMSGRAFPSGKVTFKVRLKKGVEAEAIPHLMNIAKMEALVTVSGRQPMCLNCQKLGHISRECELRYCNVCKDLKLKKHQCLEKNTSKSYASVVRKGEEYADPDDWQAAIENRPAPNKTEEQVRLAREISSLEGQILNLKSQTENSEQVKTVKKRKVAAEEVSLNDSEKNIVVSENVVDVENGSWGDQSDQSDEMIVSQGEDDELAFAQNLLDINVGDSGGVSADKVPSENTVEVTSKQLKVRVPDSENQSGSRRSYGKPNFFNNRRRREEEKFDKIADKREFVFKD